MRFYQKSLRLPAFLPGCHVITREILAALPELATIRVGMLNVFLQHTSASLTINENADPDVPRDLEALQRRWSPEDFPYRHTEEGRDDMPAHGNASLMGVSLQIPVGDGRLLLGVWQGIYLCEHRRNGGRRNLVLTLFGEENAG
ncbi:MAG: secondary thiamine-phosphate synthase enzyme YjbQ [Planctomycetia bacterium]|nr:secondary thiamine-phosphate synthase enzyme YjbQ [Planctomycetia bacterium]